VSVDVLEHVEDDREFVTELTRIARRLVLLTTPNWTAGRCTWPYHIREYTPLQLRRLCQDYGRCTMWKGTPDGSEIHPIRWAMTNAAFNWMRAAPVLALPTRAINRLLPSPARIHSHLAVAIVPDRL
jgi:hypothetical protein